jgi:hypothetical protein
MSTAGMLITEPNRCSPSMVCQTPPRPVDATAREVRDGARRRRKVTAPSIPISGWLAVRISRQSAGCPAAAVQAMPVRPAAHSTAAATF